MLWMIRIPSVTKHVPVERMKKQLPQLKIRSGVNYWVTCNCLSTNFQVVNIRTVEVFCKYLSQESLIQDVPAHRHDEVPSLVILLNTLHHAWVILHPAGFNVLTGWLTGETHHRAQTENPLVMLRIRITQAREPYL